AYSRRENREAQERFNATLPENTPAVIPEIIEMTSEHNLQLSNSSNTIDKIDLSSTEDVARSKILSKKLKPPPKGIFVPTHNKANSTDTINTMSAQQANPRLSINNSIKNNYPYSPLYTLSVPGSPITTLPVISRTSSSSPHNEGYENFVCKNVPEHRDSGISLASPVRKS
ncbi:778_t:CDS:2, partial [Acaulospora morrowiae]